MKTNIVFDFGAVLFTWRPDLLVRSLFPLQASTPAAARQLAAAIFQHEDWHAFDRGTIQMQSVITRTASRLGLPHEAVHGLITAIPEHLAPIPETVALLARLLQRRERGSDLRLFFLSNMPEPYARALEQRHKFLECFDGGVFSGDVGLVKPQSEIFQLLETRYALEPGKTLFIDDLLANVQAAQAHGWRGIHFESAEQLEPHLEMHAS